ncbi:hypothetical protein [Micromonospora craniellae]|uniref:Uncharacterized protein n=1 Tax=Micromonospora craniellae TaxID=2294034 RepID=A0A372G2B7_9ACTN|nr:hypothetical protein [Micromonospora craniellae]QOC89889.1 hypothetical protein ID554_16775 [Micromonospora craniellae]RFS47034.1 hypothetical protein D0Q02_07690 [Micromonospora craniellae]
MSDRLTAYVRTYWPLALGHLTAAIVAFVATRFGVVIDSIVVYEIIAVVLTGLVYATGKTLEERTGDGRLARVARALGRILLSFGLDTGQPTYGQPPAEADYWPDGSYRQIRSTTTYPPGSSR